MLKKQVIINTGLMAELIKLGHTDEIVICDMGLPINRDACIVDLAFVPGILDFDTVLNVLVENIVIEEMYFAKEVDRAYFEQFENKFLLKEISHDHLKQKSKDSVLFIRTGENKAYMNVILKVGVSF